MGTTPDIWFKGKRILRTAFTTALTVLPLIPQVIAVIQGEWDAEWLTAVAAQAVAINAVLTGIIAIPGVNDLLTKIGLGSVPRGYQDDADLDDLPDDDIVLDDLPDEV